MFGSGRETFELVKGDDYHRFKYRFEEDHRSINVT